jgi:hypothetical protein
LVLLKELESVRREGRKKLAGTVATHSLEEF